MHDYRVFTEDHSEMDKETTAVITWADASYDEAGRTTLDYCQSIKPYINKTVGFIVHECDDYVTLVSEIDYPEEENKITLYHGINCIPKVCIIKTEYLKVSTTEFS